MAKEKSISLMVGWMMNGRLSFPHIWEKARFESDTKKTDDELKYSFTLVWPKGSPAHKAMSAAVKQIIGMKWPGGAPPGLVHCIKDGKIKAHIEGYTANDVFVPCSTSDRFTVADRRNRILTPADDIPYAGCYVNAKLQLWCQDNGWGKKVNCQPLGLQFYAHGDAFGNKTPPAPIEDFPDLSGDDDVGEWADEQDDLLA